MDTQRKLQQLKKLESLVTLLDSKFSFLGFSFGLDGLIGLIPGVGDFAGGVISVLIIFRIKHIGVSDAVFHKMIINIFLDVFIGSVPLLGDIFDFAFKVNERNLRLARRHLEDTASFATADKIREV
jgi:hypothetical protein